MVGCRICGVEGVCVGARYAMNIICLDLNEQLSSLKAYPLNCQCLFNENYLKQKARLS